MIMPNRQPAQTLQDLLRRAISLHQSGKLAEAESAYRQVLEATPGHPDANHLLGLVAYQSGRSDLAVEYISKAISTNPNIPAYHNNRGLALLHLRQLDEAEASFKKALALKPNAADVRVNLGNVFQARGDLAAADAQYAKALEINPDYPQAHFNRGILYQEQKQYEAAEAAYRKALATQPNFAEAHGNLGNTLKEQGRFDEAIASYRQALRLNPQLVQSHSNLGIALKEMGRLDEAEACHRQALKLNPDNAEAYHNLGNVLDTQGRKEEAVESYRKAIQLKPGFTHAYRQLAYIIRFTEDNPLIATMETLWKQELTDESRLHLGFALAKAYDDTRQHSRVFAPLNTANTLRRRDYSGKKIENIHELAGQLERLFPPDFLTQYAENDDGDPTPVFIVGMPRSGTTLTEQILASHPAVHGADELVFMRHLALAESQKLTGKEYPEAAPLYTSQHLHTISQTYLERIRQIAPSAERIVDKMPSNYKYIGLIRMAFPQARIIHCQRDAMDTCFSIYKHYFAAPQPFAYDMEELGLHYLAYRRIMAHWEKVLPGHIYTMQYETLIENQEAETRNLLEFCGLPWNDACLDFHKTRRDIKTASSMQVRKPIYKTSIRSWEPYRKELAPLIRALHYNE